MNTHLSKLNWISTNYLCLVSLSKTAAIFSNITAKILFQILKSCIPIVGVELKFVLVCSTFVLEEGMFRMLPNRSYLLALLQSATLEGHPGLNYVLKPTEYFPALPIRMISAAVCSLGSVYCGMILQPWQFYNNKLTLKICNLQAWFFQNISYRFFS